MRINQEFEKISAKHKSLYPLRKISASSRLKSSGAITMRKIMFFFIFTLVGFISFCIMAYSAEKELKIQYNLSGKLSNIENKELVIIFSDDMIPIGGKREGKEIIKIKPEVDGEFFWRGTKTLVLRPKKRFKYSTKYEVRIKKGIKSLKGKILEKKIKWELITPLAYPQKYRYSSELRYHSLLYRKTADNFRPRDYLLFLFNQKISTEEMKKFLEVREEKSGEKIKFECSKYKDKEVKIKFREELKRERNYILLLKKGFRGIEGNTGTDKDFRFRFSTIPEFKYLGDKNRIIRSDERTLKLDFSTSIKIFRSDYIDIYKKVSGKWQPFNACEWRIHGENLFIYFNTALSSGEEFSLRLKKHIIDIYGDSLTHDIDLSLKICSVYPQFYSDFHDARLKIYTKSIKNAEYSLIKFKDELISQLEKNLWESLGQEDFKDKYIDFEIQKNLKFPSETAREFTLDFTKEKLDRGFLGFQVNEVEEFNNCGEIEINNFAKSFSSELKVFHLRDTDFIVKAGPDSSLFWVYNNKTNQVIPHAEISILRENQRLHLGKSDNSGLLYSNKKLLPSDIILAKNPQNYEEAFYKVRDRELFLRHKKEHAPEILVRIFSDRILYQPGDEVHIGGVIKEVIDGKVTNPKKKKAQITVWDADMEEIIDDKVELDKFGGFTNSFQTEKNYKKGEYEIEVEYKGERGYHFIMIDYYQPDSIKLEVSGIKEHYAKDDILEADLSGYYLSGNPMSEDKIEYEIFPDSLIRLRLQKKKYYAYRFNLDEYFREKAEYKTFKNEFNRHGRHKTKINLKDFQKLNYPCKLRLKIRGESREGKEFELWESTTYFPGKRIIGIKTPYFNKAKEEIKADIVMIDHSGKLSAGRGDVALFEIKRFGLFNKMKEYKDLTFKGQDTFKFQVESPGYYLIKFDAIDKDGKVVSTSDKFYVGILDFYERDTFAIETEKGDFNVGEKLRFSIRSFQKGKSLITVEKDKILDYFVVDIDKFTPLELEVKKEYFPSILIKAIAIFKDGTIEDDSIRCDIVSREKYLTVDLKTQAKEIKPSTESKIKIQVTDNQKKGEKARVFLYAVNEGNLQLYNYTTPDIFSFMYYWEPWIFIEDFKEAFSKFNNSWSYKGKDFDLKGSAILGKVIDDKRQPLSGVRVTLESYLYFLEDKARIKIASSNENGFYLVGKIPMGSYILTFEKEGFKSRKEYIFLRENFHKLDIRMEKEDLEKEKKAEIKKEVKKRLECIGLAISGIIQDEEGNPLPGVEVILFKGENLVDQFASTVSDEIGRYCFGQLFSEKYLIKFVLPGFNTVTKEIEVRGSSQDVNATMTIGTIAEEITVSGEESVPESLRQLLEDRPKVSAAVMDFQSFFRKDFQEVLFFKKIETDENGRAEVEFKTSDQLSTYRIMAVAYSEDCFGSAEKNIVVTKNMYIEEAMPEFAREGDQFEAGVQVSNRTEKEIEIALIAQPSNISIQDSKEKHFSVKEKSNQLIPFNFSASQAGEASIKFFALSENEKDGIIKNLRVSPNLISESILDFDSGNEITKTIQPQKNVEEQKLKIKVARSILKPAVKVAEKLIFYPYNCLEQKASKVMPFLILEDTLIDMLGLEIDREQVKNAIDEYINLMPEFMSQSGGLSYYKNGKYISPYLTIYVLWSLYLAERKGYTVDKSLVEKMENYLKSNLSLTFECFYQYVLSLKNKADKEKLKRLYVNRDELSITEKVFLYRALSIQFKDRQKLRVLLSEFNNSLQVEADFCYFDAGEFEYNMDLPFYSSRYVTALILQAILEVEGDFLYAPKIMNWLLECPVYYWDTTQTNFWILYTMSEYFRKVEKGGAEEAELKVLDERVVKKFKTLRDELKLDKNIEKEKQEFDLGVSSDKLVYLTTELNYKIRNAPKKSRGIEVKRNVYDETGKIATEFDKGKVYQVELLLDIEKEVPYAVIDEPLAAGFEVLRQDFVTTRKLKEFNRDHSKKYYSPWLRREHVADRIIYYTYMLSGKIRVVYFVKALYSGHFTWLPIIVQGMYHPQYYGRESTRTLKIKEKDNNLSEWRKWLCYDKRKALFGIR